ncbi:MAG TPA: Druantia anti-phage system protein DruA [Candidatus Baltobacteraceae bacterium]|nr:Druantia anti-phage system protein DruA [Candidatus Baltobacteraceae bacterium]
MKLAGTRGRDRADEKKRGGGAARGGPRTATLRAQIVSASEAFWNAASTHDKARIQEMHVAARNLNTVSRSNAAESFERYKQYFIDGRDLDPSSIRPIIKIVRPRTDEEKLFQIARWTWSLPYSTGYGRRLRFVVWDSFHGALIGVIGLQSPPVDLSARDRLFSYPSSKKLDLINRTLDAYTIGAIPPYSNVLGGKLVAGLVASSYVHQMYWVTYGGRKTQMARKRIRDPLVAITTTSAFGRSSIYNRLRYKDRTLAHPIGYTRGCGPLHLEALYPQILQFLKKYEPELVLGGYGHGPKQRWQLIKRALDRLGVPRRYFEHGVKRQVFLYPLVADLNVGMAGGDFGPRLELDVEDYSAYWRERWAIPRSKRDGAWRGFRANPYFVRALYGPGETDGI